MQFDSDIRWREIDRQLEELAEGKVVSGDPAKVEAELFAEQDELEWQAGEDYFRERE